MVDVLLLTDTPEYLRICELHLRAFASPCRFEAPEILLKIAIEYDGVKG